MWSPQVTCCLFAFFQSVLEGYNGTVMAYGQTGTGKTFTLGRLGEEDCADRGIMVRAMEDILANINPGEDTVTVSYLQVAPCSLFLLVTMATNMVLSELQDFQCHATGY